MTIITKKFSQNIKQVYDNALQACQYSQFLQEVTDKVRDSSESGLSDILNAETDIHFFAEYTYPETKEMILILFQLEWIALMIIDLGVNYDPCIHMSQAMNNAMGQMSEVEIIAAGQKVYVGTQTINARLKRMIDNPLTLRYYKNIYDKEL